MQILPIFFHILIPFSARRDSDEFLSPFSARSDSDEFLSSFSARSDSSEFLISSLISSPARRDSDEIPKVKS